MHEVNQFVVSDAHLVLKTKIRHRYLKSVDYTEAHCFRSENGGHAVREAGQEEEGPHDPD